jgi:hypothetical protein
MAQPGNRARRLITVMDASGAAVTGLVLANFTTRTWACDAAGGAFAAYSANPTLTEKGGGLYDFAYDYPSQAGWADVQITHATHTVYDNRWSGEVEGTDLDAVTALVVRPQVTVSTSAVLGDPITLTLIAYRWRQVLITVLDQNRNPYPNLATDFPAANLRLSVRSANQTTTVWDSGPPGTPAGFTLSISGSVITIEFPETCTFFTALAAGVASVDLFWELTGDYQGNAAKTVALVPSSTLTLRRREVGT